MQVLEERLVYQWLRCEPCRLTWFLRVSPQVQRDILAGDPQVLDWLQQQKCPGCLRTEGQTLVPPLETWLPGGMKRIQGPQVRPKRRRSRSTPKTPARQLNREWTGDYTCPGCKAELVVIRLTGPTRFLYRCSDYPACSYTHNP